MSEKQSRFQNETSKDFQNVKYFRKMKLIGIDVKKKLAVQSTFFSAEIKQYFLCQTFSDTKRIYKQIRHKQVPIGVTTNHHSYWFVKFPKIVLYKADIVANSVTDTHYTIWSIYVDRCLKPLLIFHLKVIAGKN